MHMDGRRARRDRQTGRGPDLCGRHRQRRVLPWQTRSVETGLEQHGHSMTSSAGSNAKVTAGQVAVDARLMTQGSANLRRRVSRIRFLGQDSAVRVTLGMVELETMT